MEKHTELYSVGFGLMLRTDYTVELNATLLAPERHGAEVCWVFSFGLELPGSATNF